MSNIYENVKIVPSSSSSSSCYTDSNYDQISIRSSYDEVSINFGKPVVIVKEPTEDPLQNVSFKSPIHDLDPSSRKAVINGQVIPIPAPRYSKIPIDKPLYENFEPDKKLPKKTSFTDDNGNREGVEPETLDIRNVVERIYDQAEEELQRDLSLDFSVLERIDNPNSKVNNNTLLRCFDPILEPEECSSPSRTSDDNSFEDLPPPTSPPPPLPSSSPPLVDNNKEEETPQNYPSPTDSSSLASNNSSDFEFLKRLRIADEGTNRTQSSASNLNWSKMASQIKRKMSDQSLIKKVVTGNTGERVRRHSLLVSGGIKSGTLNHNGVLFLWSKHKKNFRSKWVVLSNGKLQYYNEKDSLATPKEAITLSSLLSVSIATQDVGGEFYAFHLTYASSTTNKYALKTFGTRTANERQTWMEKLIRSLSYKLSDFEVSESSRLGWGYLKEGFAGDWMPTWLSIKERKFYYHRDDSWIVMDLRKTKDITVKKDVKILEPPLPSVPILLMDFVDRSLYVVVNHEKECEAWGIELQSRAFKNGTTLTDQQQSKEGIPVIVDKCIKFIFSHGCMSEGIYRQSGVKTKIDRLLDDFKSNAWSVQIWKEQYSEHDVANTLKRFMRTIEEPLLTRDLRSDWMKTSEIKDLTLKTNRYKELLNDLPEINYNTLRKLICHLHSIASQCDRNLMPDYNLASIWGPTLLTVDGQKASDFAKTSRESDVCKDLIVFYYDLFDVKEEEIQREQKIIEVMERIGGQNRELKRSGDIRIWVYIDTKTSGNCVCLVVYPSMTASEMTRLALEELKKTDDEEENRLYLHEVVLGGMLERPLYPSENILNLTLTWGTWDEEAKKDNYLLLKRNALYDEALLCVMPALSVFGEASFGENKFKSKFAKALFSMNNAKISCYRETKGGVPTETGSWPIEEIRWYIGVEEKRKAPHRLNITFIEREVPVVRCKDKPYFGHTISFEHYDLFIKWIASMLVAEYSGGLTTK